MISPLLLPPQVPAPYYFSASTRQPSKQTAAKAKEKAQPATRGAESWAAQARRKRAEGKHSQLGNGSARNQKDPEGLTRKNRKGISSRGTCIRFGGKGGKNWHPKKQNSRSVNHEETGTADLPRQHTGISRETVCFLCPRYVTGLGMQFCSLSEKHCCNSSTFCVCSTCTCQGAELFWYRKQELLEWAETNSDQI